MRRERPQEVVPARLQAFARALVLPPGAVELARQSLLARRPQARGVLGVGVAADVRDEGPEALADAGRLELVAEDRGQRERQRGAPVEQVEQRQVAAGDRLPQPLLAEGPGAEALDVGHVRVQDDRQRARSRRLTGGTPR